MEIKKAPSCERLNEELQKWNEKWRTLEGIGELSEEERDEIMGLMSYMAMTFVNNCGALLCEKIREIGGEDLTKQNLYLIVAALRTAEGALTRVAPLSEMDGKLADQLKDLVLMHTVTVNVGETGTTVTGGATPGSEETNDEDQDH